MQISITGILSMDELTGMFTVTKLGERDLRSKSGSAHERNELKETGKANTAERSLLCKLSSKVPVHLLLDGKKIGVSGQWSESMQCLLVDTIVVE